MSMVPSPKQTIGKINLEVDEISLGKKRGKSNGNVPMELYLVFAFDFVTCSSNKKVFFIPTENCICGLAEYALQFIFCATFHVEQK